MPGYEKMESLKNGGSWGKFWCKTCGFERVKWDTQVNRAQAGFILFLEVQIP